MSTISVKAAAEVLVEELNDKQVFSLALGESVLSSGTRIDPLQFDYTSLNPLDEAIIEIIACRVQLYNSLMQHLNERTSAWVLKGSVAHLDYARIRFLQHREEMLLFGSTAIKTGGFGDAFQRSISTMIESYKYFCLQTGLSDNGLKIGSWIRQIPFVGKEWKILKEFRTQILVDKIREKLPIIEKNLQLCVLPGTEKTFRNFLVRCNDRIKKINLETFFIDCMRYRNLISIKQSEMNDMKNILKDRYVAPPSSLSVDALYGQRATLLKDLLLDRKSRMLTILAFTAPGDEVKDALIVYTQDRIKLVNKVILNPLATSLHYFFILLDITETLKGVLDKFGMIEKVEVKSEFNTRLGKKELKELKVKIKSFF